MKKQNIDFSHFGKVAVLMGGCSHEREVSLQSGQRALQALLNYGIDAQGIDVQGDVVQRLLAGKFDRALIMLHGPGGEDGVMQGLLRSLNIPYAGSDVGAAAITLDKPRCKILLRAAGLNTPDFMVINDGSQADEVIEKLGLPLAIKPVREGSSLGLSKVTMPDQFKEAYLKAIEYDNYVMAEAWISGTEYTVGIVAGQAYPVVEIRTSREIYDYLAKETPDGHEYICPCNLGLVQQNELQNLALLAFTAAGCRHWGRVDVIRDQQGQFWFLEINSIPGMTAKSLLPTAARAKGMSYDELVLQLLEQTLDNDKYIYSQ